MNLWLTAAVALFPALAAAGLGGGGGRCRKTGFVALELGTTLAVFMLMLLSVGYDQPSFIDLGLTARFAVVPRHAGLCPFSRALAMTAGELAEIALSAWGLRPVGWRAFGLLRLPDAFARLHCVSFAGAAGGLCFTAAVLIDRGGDPLGFKSRRDDHFAAADRRSFVACQRACIATAAASQRARQ